MAEVKCPYCEKKSEVNVSAFKYPEGSFYFDACNQCCEHCNKNFKCHLLFEGFQVACLNEGEHNYKRSKPERVELTLMICACGKSRSLTPQEWEDFDKVAELPNSIRNIFFKEKVKELLDDLRLPLESMNKDVKKRLIDRINGAMDILDENIR